MEGSGDIPFRELPQTVRFEELKQQFFTLFKKDPDFYVRVPGRVNLIGEHIDYCGYGVCPMALEQDILVAASTEDDAILRLHNLDPIYPSYECSLKDFSILIGEGAPMWHQYFLCGVKGIFEILPKGADIKGLNVVLSGTVPQSSGLSSSSALVSAAALTTAHSHNLPMSKEEIANLCAECERYIGTQGGGMDQAIAFLATEGCAKFIEFSPLRTSDITLPAGAVFVIAHSLAKLNKAATADFNCRVVECRLAAQIIAKKMGLEWMNVQKLHELQTLLDVDLVEMVSLTETTLHEGPYLKEEVIRELETTSDYLANTSLTANTRSIESFKLRQRALHVFQEALRVEKFHSVCSKSSSGEGSLGALGALMSDSHESLRNLYECSHPQVDKLVELSTELALGCRVTGAGWGGCVVALLRAENVDKYMALLQEKFYMPLGHTQVDSVLFATKPQSGACIFIKTCGN